MYNVFFSFSFARSLSLSGSFCLFAVYYALWVTFSTFFFHFIQLHFPRSFQRIILFFFSFFRSFVLSLFQCKQVCAVWILYNLSDLLRNTICTYWISFCRVEFALCECVCVVCTLCVLLLLLLLLPASVSFFLPQFNEILNFWTNTSGRGTRNWRMLMNKNAWKKESALAHKQTPNKYWNINVPVVNDFLLWCIRSRSHSVFSLFILLSWCALSLCCALLASQAIVVNWVSNKEFHS